MEQYGYMASIYDKMIDINYDQWIDFLEKYLKTQNTNIRGKKCLELGCGTGNMTLRLKQRGADVTAMDISQEMLSIAEEKLRKHKYIVKLIDGDMAEFKIDKKFDFVFSFCDGYNYILDDSELQKSFDIVYNQLNKNGHFIFDISTEYKLKSVIGVNTYTLNEDDLCYIWDNYIEDDILDMYITFFKKYNGNMYKRFDEHHIQRARSVKYITDCLKKSGFENIRVFDDYSLKEINTNSLRATIAAQREE